MGRPLGMTTTAILAALRGGARYGLELIERTGLRPGTVYTALRRLEARDLLEGRWEAAEVAEREARPRRRYYRLTAAGEVALGEAVDHYRALDGTPLGAPVGETGE